MKKKITEFMNTVSMRMAGVSEKREAGDHMLEILGVIIIVIVLLIFFKDKLKDIITTATSGINSNMNASQNGLWKAI